MVVPAGWWRSGRRRPPLLVALGAAAVLVSGCGTTVDIRSLEGRGGIGGDVSEAQRPGDSVDQAVGASVPTESGPGSLPGADVGAAESQAAAVPGLSPLPAAGRSGRGFTAKEVFIGMGDLSDTSTITALGVGGIGSTGSARAQAKALVDDINRRGGLAGRKMVLVWYAAKTSDVLFDPNTVASAQCEYWANDHPVFAVVGAVVTNEVFLECMKRVRVPVINASGVFDDSAYQLWYDRYPLYFNIGVVQGERFNRISTQRLVARKFFAPWDTLLAGPGSAPVKIGILENATPSGDAALRSRKRELARFGLKPAYVFRTSEDLSTNQSQMSGAVLRFKAEGITHVFGAGTTFMNQADSQQYRPRYFIPTNPVIFAATATGRSLNGAMGEGFVPAQDVPAEGYPGHPSPATGYCLDVMRKAGQTVTDQTTLWVMEGMCDMYFTLKDGVDAAGTLTSDAFRRGLESLRWKAKSALTWTTYLGPGEHATARAVRDIAFRENADGSHTPYYTDKRNWVV